jgi:hypothetical protein
MLLPRSSEPSPLRRHTAGFAVLALVIAIAVAGCNSNNGGNGDHTGPGTPIDAGNGDPDNGGEPQPATPAPYTDPWARAAVGDTAVYETAQHGRETWTLIALGATATVRITRDEVDPFSGESLGEIAEELEFPRRSEPDRAVWWSSTPTAERDSTPVELADGTTLSAFTVTVGDRTLRVSDDAPMDGVVIETRSGSETPVRRLVSFTRAAATD